MQILTREGNYETRSASATAPWGSTAPPAPGSIGGSLGGVQITEQTALQLAAVWGSVSLIADSIATLPIKQYRQVGSDEAKQMEAGPVIQRPWAEITQRDFVTQGTLSMLLRGNLWGNVAARDSKLYPEQVQLVHPDHAKIRRDQKTGELEARYWYQKTPIDDGTRAWA